MPDPLDMGPADLAPNTTPPPRTDIPQRALVAQRNAYYNSLPPAAKERFLDVLADAERRGLDEEAAWDMGVRAVEGLGDENL